MKRVSIDENFKSTNTQNQKKSAKMSGTYGEEGGLGEFKTHKAYRRACVNERQNGSG